LTAHPANDSIAADTSRTAAIAYSVCATVLIVSPPDACTIVAANGRTGSNRKVMPSSGLAEKPRPPETMASMIASPSARAVASTVAATIAGRAVRNDTRTIVRQRLTPSAIDPSRQAIGTEASAPAISATMIGVIITARITVATAAPASAEPTMDELFRRNVFDAYFDFNKADIRSDARDALGKTADFFRNYPQIRVTIEGHCDERGSTEYNLALGDRRASAVKQYLVSLGISADRLNTVSFGKEKPFCMQSTEACYQQNRRGHFVRSKQ